MKTADDRRRTLNMGVHEFEWSTRAANGLRRAGIATLGELAQRTEADLLACRNVGRTTLAEVSALLSERGLALGMKLEPGWHPLGRLRLRPPVTVRGLAVVLDMDARLLAEEAKAAGVPHDRELACPEVECLCARRGLAVVWKEA